jgi:hypothetical protein
MAPNPRICAAYCVAILAALGQTPGARSVLGTVTAFRADRLEIEVKPDSGEAAAFTFTPETLVERIAPGEKDLKNAAPAKITDISLGDRVLVTPVSGTHEARRILLMSASDIARRNEADSQDWMKRGVSGLVVAKSASQVTVKMRSFQGETQAMVTIGDKTKFRRYAPDSVRFVDAKPSSLSEVAIGDQLRARGQKSEDGLKVDAEEVVFGTFLTKAGTVTTVDAGAKQIVVKDLVTNKPLTIKLTADSQLKALPNFAGMMGGGRMGQMGGPRAGAAPGRPAFDLAQMLERMPAAKLEDLKPGQTILVSSTKGASKDQVTAIMLLANADLLIQMAAAQSNRSAAAGAGMGPSMGMMGLSGGLDNLGMPGMIP